MDNSGTSYNYTAILPAGSFYWKSYANDSLAQWSSSSTWYFTVAKAIPGLNITAQPGWTATYGTQTNVSCSANTSEVTPTLYRNGTLIAGLSDVAILPGGVHNYTCNSTQVNNYSSGSTWSTMSITPDLALSTCTSMPPGTTGL